MRSSLVAILFACLIAHSGYAQTTLTESLRHLLANSKKDTGRVLLLGRMASTYVFSKPDTALRIAEEGLTLARKLKFPAGEANCLNAIGQVFQTTGNYPKALEMFLHALKIREDIRDERGIAASYNNLGSLYSNQDDYRQCLNYVLKGREIAGEIHSDRPLLISLLYIGNAYEKLGLLDSARFTTQQAYELAVKIHNIDGKGFSSNVLGNIHAKMGESALALDYYRLSLPDLAAENDHDAICEATLGMAQVFTTMGKPDSALIYARRSLQTARKGGFTKRLLNASTFFSAYYKDIRNIDSAYAYQEITIAAKDSLFSQEKTREVQNLSFTEQIRQQEITEAAVQAAEERRKNVQIAGIALFFPLFFGIVLLLRKRKARPRAIEFLGILGLLLFFEYITLVIHPYVAAWTHESPVLMLLILVAVASLLAPMHHKLEHWIKERLVPSSAQKILATEIPAADIATTDDQPL